MNGFGFIEYEDAMDARDVVPGKSLSPITFLAHLLLPNSQLTRSTLAFRMLTTFSDTFNLYIDLRAQMALRSREHA